VVTVIISVWSDDIQQCTALLRQFKQHYTEMLYIINVIVHSLIVTVHSLIVTVHSLIVTLHSLIVTVHSLIVTVHSLIVTDVFAIQLLFVFIFFGLQDSCSLSIGTNFSARLLTLCDECTLTCVGRFLRNMISTNLPDVQCLNTRKKVKLNF
jgi:hypothetical protein